jgi:hypothetical protein
MKKWDIFLLPFKEKCSSINIETHKDTKLSITTDKNPHGTAEKKRK